MVEINLLDKYPKSKRPIEERGNLITEQHRTIARQFGQDFLMAIASTDMEVIIIIHVFGKKR